MRGQPWDSFCTSQLRQEEGLKQDAHDGEHAAPGTADLGTWLRLAMTNLSSVCCQQMQPNSSWAKASAGSWEKSYICEHSRGEVV